MQCIIDPPPRPREFCPPGLSPALALDSVSPVAPQTQSNERAGQNLEPVTRATPRQGDPAAALPGIAAGQRCASCGARPLRGSASSAALAAAGEAGFPRLCNRTSRAPRGLGSASVLRPAPRLRRPSHGMDGGGGGEELRGSRRAHGAHAPVRPAANAAGRALRGAGQLRRRAGLARPR